jgi:hypothetical protein
MYKIMTQPTVWGPRRVVSLVTEKHQQEARAVHVKAGWRIFNMGFGDLGSLNGKKMLDQGTSIGSKI